jgi:molybdopterin-guanine dinucleotide biosynthesis protein A
VKSLKAQTVIVVSPDANDYLEANKVDTGDSQVIPFTARLHQEAERARLFAFLHAENYKLTQIIHNQPFLFKPVEKERQLNLDSESAREQQRAQ